MKYLKLALLALLLTACATQGINPTEYITRYHDDAGDQDPGNDVTCWVFWIPGGSGGISCIPDSQLEKQ